jgi:hypothetical protein
VRGVIEETTMSGTGNGDTTLAHPASESVVLQETPGTPSRRRTRRIAAGALVLGLVAAPAAQSTWSAFSARVQHNNNTFSSGSVVLTDNTADGSTLLTASNMKPGDTVQACVTLSYTGSLAADVKSYAAITGSGLDQYLTYTVTEGNFGTAQANGSTSCTGFTPLGSNATWGTGNLSAYPTTYAAGIQSAAAAQWNPNTSRAVKVDLVLQDVNAAQNKNATAQVYFEARNR